MIRKPWYVKIMLGIWFEAVVINRIAARLCILFLSTMQTEKHPHVCKLNLYQCPINTMFFLTCEYIELILLIICFKLVHNSEFGRSQKQHATL